MLEILLQYNNCVCFIKEKKYAEIWNNEKSIMIIQIYFIYLLFLGRENENVGFIFTTGRKYVLRVLFENAFIRIFATIFLRKFYKRNLLSM